MAEWELSKENIQPLRQGRKASAMLDQVDSKKIAEEKQAFELALRTYDGDDPLEPWNEYIIWVEQTFSKSGKDGNLVSLLEKCIKQFKGNPLYEQDPRFLSVWMKYAHLSSSPLEVYTYMHSENVCHKLAKFYIEWAWELEQVNNFKRAEKTFALALATIEDPEEREILEVKHKQFQARVMKKMLEVSDTEDPQADVEQRTVLSSLKGFGKKHQVGSIRVGAAKIADGPGTLVASGQVPKAATTQFKIHSDLDAENNPRLATSLKSSSSSSSLLPGSKERNLENEQDPSKWTQSRLGKKASAVPLSQVKSSFAVHQDEGIVTPSKGGASTAGVLSCHKPKKCDEDDVPIAVALFEPPDPTKKAMYCKHLVYQGVTEFSIEELRAVRYRHKEAISETEQLRMEKEKFELEMRASREALMRQEEQMRLNKLDLEAKMSNFEKMMASMQENMQTIMEEKLRKQQAEIDALRREKLASAEFVAPAKPIKEKIMKEEKRPAFKIYSDSATEDKSSKEASSSLLEDTKTLLQRDPLGTSSSSSLHKTPPRLDLNKLSQPSPTINTKEAMNLMQEMWLSNTDKKEKPKFSVLDDESKSAVKPKVPAFQVFQDHDENAKPAFQVFQDHDENQKPAFQVFQDSSENQKPAFQVFQDSSENQKPAFQVFQDSSENQKPAFQVFQDSSENQKPAFQVFQDNSESQKPAFQVFQDTKEANRANSIPKPNIRPIVANNVENRAPKKEAKAIEEEEDDNPKTFFVPSMQDFEMLAKASSTPFCGRGFIPEEDENTCAVDLVFKKPTLPPTNTKASSEDNTTEPIVQQQPPLAPLSPIMETSRENYKSSSTSSSNASQSHLTKSHWGNTHLGGPQNATALGAFLPSNKSMASNNKSFKPLNELTGNSGYMADSSSARTPGLFLATKKPFLNSPSSGSQGKEKKLKMVFEKEDVDDEDYEITGLIPNFAQEDPSFSATANCRRPENSYMQQSLVASFAETEESLCTFGAGGMSNKSRLELSKPHLEARPNLELSSMADLSRPAGLEISRPMALDISKPALDISRPGAAMLDITPEEPNEVANDMANMSLAHVFNPFDPEVHAKLLSRIDTPVEARHGYVALHGQKMPQFRPNSNVKIGDVEFFCMESKGEGGYGKVFKAMRCDSDNNDTIADLDAVLKVQKPARPWEFYICTEIHARLAKMQLNSSRFMSIPRCYAFDDGSVFASEHQLLSLLDVCNIVTSMRTTSVEPIAMFFVIEVLHILENLQKCNVIHGDIKPDNFLVQRKPELNEEAPNGQMMFQKATLQVIDFGVSIDMSLFAQGHTFTHKFDKVDNRCPEMRQDRPWSYHLDYFGVAGIAHTLLHGSYMTLVKKNDIFMPTGSFKRWWKTQLWSDFFEAFLNIKGNNFPDVVAMRTQFEDVFFSTHKKNFDKAASELNKLIKP